MAVKKPKPYEIGELDQYLFGQGNHYEIYKKLGAHKVKKQYPDALTLFVMTPDAEELRYRLESRGTESAEVIEKRMQRAAEEAMGIEKYEYIVVNDNLEKCVDEVHRIIMAAHNAAHRNREFIDNIRKELEGEK